MKLPTRQERLAELRANIGTFRETPKTHERIAQYEAMTDEAFDAHIAQTRAATISAMARSAR